MCSSWLVSYCCYCDCDYGCSGHCLRGLGRPNCRGCCRGGYYICCDGLCDELENAVSVDEKFAAAAAAAAGRVAGRAAGRAVGRVVDCHVALDMAGIVVVVADMD